MKITSKKSIMLIIPTLVLGIGLIWRLLLPNKPQTLYNELLSASGSNDVIRMKAAIANGANIDGKPFSEEDTGVTPLAVAASSGSMNAAEFLLTNGANPSLIESWGDTPLVAAARSNHKGTLIMLINHGAAINDDGDGSSALWAAATVGNTDIANILLANGANPQTKRSIGNSKMESVYNVAMDFHHEETAKAIESEISKQKVRH